jgi:hypothetical protein
MNTQEIANFIKSQLKLNTSRAEIERILSLNHIPTEQVASAFQLALGETNAPETPVAPAPEAPAQPEAPGEAFPPKQAPFPNGGVVIEPRVEFKTPPQMPEFNPAPPAPPAPQAPPAAPVMPHPSHWLRSLFILIIIVLLAAGGTAAYAYFYQPTWLAKLPWLTEALTEVPYIGPMVQDIDSARVLSDMAESLKNAKSATFELSGQIKAPDTGTSTPAGLISLSGASDWSLTDNIKTSASLRLEAQNMASSSALSLLSDVRVTDQTLYFKAVNLPKFGFFDFSTLSDLWLKIPFTEARGQVPQMDELENFDPESFKTKFLAGNPVHLTKVGTETLNGVETIRYQVTIDEQKMLELSKSLPLEDSLGDTEINTETLKPAINLWIGAADHLPYKLTVSGLAESKTKLGSQANFDLNLILSGFGQPISLSLPEQSLSLEEAMKRMLTGATTTISTAPRTATSTGRELPSLYNN